MNGITIILIGAGALLLGVGIGYYLRLIIALGKRRSIEIDIKQMLIGAKEEAQRIVDEAKHKSEEKLAKTEEEENILTLSQKSQAAFKFDFLNPNGSVFMLLSGGGASIVLADEVANQGFGKELANYGEYSGNPNEEETFIYTKNLLSLLLKSKAPKKVLIIGFKFS